MCCFSRPVPYVAGTKIFARAHGDGRQVLVYSMRFAAAEELAMILPIPVPPASAEEAVRFVSLEGYDGFFDDVQMAFPLIMAPLSRSAGPSFPMPESRKLKVYEVGDFEASFVPTQADFERLDERFKLDPAVWAKLPQYADWGFAVFKLRPKKAGTLARLFRRAKKQRVHPMAFVFPNRHPEQLFFPAVHVHDGEVHETADFNHTLYGQLDGEPDETWERSEKALGAVMNAERAKGLVDPEAHCWRRVIRGPHENRDITLGPPA